MSSHRNEGFFAVGDDTAMTIDGSPTGTGPSRWWIAHRILEDIGGTLGYD